MTGERLRQDVAGHVALEHFVALVQELRERALGDRDEGQLVGNLEHGKRALARLGEQGRRQPLVREARAEAEARDLVLVQTRDQLALGLRAIQLHARRQQQLAPAQPRRRIDQLGAVHPADGRLRRFVAARQLKPELDDQALDSELQLPTRSDASLSTGRSTASISSNCSSPAINGGES